MWCGSEGNSRDSAVTDTLLLGTLCLMLTHEKLNVYQRYAGDADAWARARVSDRQVLSDEDWATISELLDRISLKSSGATAKSFDDETAAMVEALSIDCGVADELISLATLRDEEARRVGLPLAYRLLGPGFIAVPFLFWFFVSTVEMRAPVREEWFGYVVMLAFGLFTTWQHERKATVSPFMLIFSSVPLGTAVPWVDIARVELGKSWLVFRINDGRVRKLSTSSRNADWLAEQARRRKLL